MGEVKEEWKTIDGFDGMYSVSNRGNVMAHSREVAFGSQKRVIKEHLLSPTSNGTGYLKVYISYKNKTKSFFVHRLVANAFLGDPPNGATEVNHIDYNRANNDVSNLEWTSRFENVQHSKCNIPKHHVEKTRTGERYIGMRNGKYRVCLGGDKTFKTIEDAIEFRNKICAEMGIDLTMPGRKK